MSKRTNTDINFVIGCPPHKKKRYQDENENDISIKCANGIIKVKFCFPFFDPINDSLKRGVSYHFRA